MTHAIPNEFVIRDGRTRFVIRQVDCDDYLEHQSYHRRVVGGWICDACYPAP